MPTGQQAAEKYNLLSENGNKHEKDYPDDLKIQPGQLRIMCLKKGTVIFRASRNDEMPSPNWFKKEIERFAEQKKEEWSGRYFFLSADGETPTIKDIEPYAADFVDELTGKGVYRLEQRVINQDLFAILNTNLSHGTNAVTGDIKALAIKDYLKENGLGPVNDDDDNFTEISLRIKQCFCKENTKLLPILDNFDLAYLGPHTEEGDLELILSPNALKKVKPKDITQVMAYDCNEENESPMVFLQNTDTENTRSLRTKFLSKYTKPALKFPKEHVMQDENPDFPQIIQPHLDANLESIHLRTVLQNQYRFLMAETSPMKIVKDVAELVRIGVNLPFELASIVRPTNFGEEHVTSKLANMVAGGGIAPLAEAWISLLYLLYEQSHLNGEDVISIVLPHIKRDTIKSLAHSLAGSAWSSDATTKLCSLLSKLASNNEKLRQQIIERLFMKQYGYNFKLQVLNRYSDFYNRAKHADMIQENKNAIEHLAEGKLIPEHRQLYKRVTPRTQVADIYWDSRLDKLQDKIKNEIVPRVQASFEKISEDKAELERAKISAREALHVINSNKTREKNSTYDKILVGLNTHFATQALLHDHSKAEKILYEEKIRALSANQDTKYTVGGAASIVMPLMASALSKHVIKTIETPYYSASGAHYNHEYTRNEQKTAEIQQRIDSLRAPSIDKSLEKKLDSLKGFNIDRSLEQRLDSLKQFNSDWALEKRLDSLRAFNTDLSLEKRLNNLRSSSTASKRKQLAPALRAD